VTKCAQQFIVELMLSDGCHNEERIILSSTTATRRYECLLVANIHSNRRSCSLAGLKWGIPSCSRLDNFSRWRRWWWWCNPFRLLISFWRHIKRLEEMSSKRWWWRRIDCKCLPL